MRAAAALALLLWAAAPALAQEDRALSGRAQALDADGSGTIERGEARGPLAENFEAMDCDRSGALDGAEIRAFFRDGGCPEAGAAADGPEAAAAGAPPAGEDTALSGRARALDADGDGAVGRGEARGPLAENFEAIDEDKSGTLDGAEIRAFFRGRGGGGGGGGRPPASVRLDEVIAEPMGQTVPAIGRLVARQNGVVSAEIRGVVEEMRVDVGDRVARGQIVAVIARDRLAAARARQAAAVARMEAMVGAAGAEHDKKRRELARLDRLRRSAAFSRARYEDLERDVQARRGALDERRAQLEEAKALLRQAELDLADARIRAPFPGVVTEKHTETGSYLSPGAPVVSLVNDTETEVEADVPAARLGALAPGVEIGMRLDDDGSRHRASVRAVIPSENPRTRTRPVRLTPRFEGRSAALAANQTVTLLIPVGGGETVTTVHKDAVVRGGAKAFVYVVEDGAARRVEVALGDSVGGRFVVLDGLAPGQRVVVHGNESLGQGGPVRVTGPPAGEAGG